MLGLQYGLTTSASVMLMVIIGGAGTLFGPAIGAALIVLLEHFVSSYTPERWPLILGSIFVICVMFIRGGVLCLYVADLASTSLNSGER